MNASSHFLPRQLQRNLLGMITETDLLRLVTQGVEGQPPADATVADFMSTEVVTVDPETPWRWAQ